MSTVTVRVDEQTKQTAMAVLSDLGMDVSTAVRVFLRQVAIRGKMPIELVQDSFYSQSNLSTLQRSIKQLEDGEVIVTTADELKAME